MTPEVPVIRSRCVTCTEFTVKLKPTFDPSPGTTPSSPCHCPGSGRAWSPSPASAAPGPSRSTRPSPTWRTRGHQRFPNTQFCGPNKVTASGPSAQEGQDTRSGHSWIRKIGVLRPVQVRADASCGHLKTTPPPAASVATAEPAPPPAGTPVLRQPLPPAFPVPQGGAATLLPAGEAGTRGAR